MLWSLFPHHRYLLDTDFVVNDELAKTGYAVKPISGRCGNNIDLISPHDEVLDQTSGQFVDRKNIYQQRCGVCRRLTAVHPGVHLYGGR